MGRRDEIIKARKTLGLAPEATIAEIKQAYRELSLKYHPDKSSGTDRKKNEEKFKELNSANRVLMEYCMEHRFRFDEAGSGTEAKDSHLRDHMKRFYDGWWGELGDE